MRTFLILALCGATTAPAAVLAQAAPLAASRDLAPNPPPFSEPVAVTPPAFHTAPAGASGGPAGKFTGSMVGKREARSLLDPRKDDGAPQLGVVQAHAFSAEDAGASAVAEPATAPALIPASDRRPGRP